MKKITLLFFYLFFFNSINAQIGIIEGLNSSTLPTGWSISPNSWDFGSTTTLPCEGAAARRHNYYSFSATAGMTTSNYASVSNGTDIAYSFQWKSTEYSADSGVGITMNAEYSTDDGVTWVVIGAPIVTTTVTECATFSAVIPAASVPLGTSLKFRWNGTWSAGDCYFMVDNISITQVSSTPPLCTSLTTPADLATNVNSSIVSWTGAEGIPSGYKLKVGTTPGGTELYNLLDVGAVTTYNLGILASGTTYYVTVIPYNSNGNATGCTESSFTTCASNTAPSMETFSTFVPGCWQVATGGDALTGPTAFGSSNWYDKGFANVGNTGAANYNIYGINDNAWLITPFHSVPTAGYEIKYDAAATQYGSTAAPTTPWAADDFVEVLVSTGLTNWTVLYTYDSTNNPSNTVTPNIIDLDAYAGQNVRFAFRVIEGATSGGDIDFFVDNFQFRLTPSCSDVSDLAYNSVTTTDANITWNIVGTETSWQYVYGLASVTDPTTLTPISVTVNSGTLSGLISNTEYKFWVRSDCGTSGYGAWIGPVSFNTLCNPFGDFNENFDSVTAFENLLPNCWSKLLITTDNWVSLEVVSPWSGANSAPNAIELNNSGDSAAVIMLITPSLTALPLDTHRIKFRAKASTGYTVSVGTMSDPTDETTFVEAQLITLTGTFDEYVVAFNTSTSDTYVAFKHGLGGLYRSILIDDFVWEAIPATAPNCATAVTATPDTSCGNYPTVLSWTAPSGADGYLLTVGTTAGGFDILDSENIGNVTSYSLEGNFNSTYYYTVVPYNDNGSATGCVEYSFTTAVNGCYCPSIPTSNDASGITNVLLGTTSFTNGDVTYFDHTATNVDLAQTIEANLQISFATGYTYGTNVWIDFNDDYVFDASEIVFTGVSLSANPTVLNASFIMPATAALGVHRMRIATADSGQDITPDPCYSGTFGVTLDFSVTIIAPPACLPITGLTTTSIAATAANVAWMAPNPVPALGYEYFVATTNTAPLANDTPTGSVAAGITSVDLSSLNPVTTYYVWVRSKCGATDVSSWSISLSFTTPCLPNTTLPWEEGFESVSTGNNIFPSCWAYVNTLGNWSISTSPTANTGTNSLRRTYNTDGWAFTPTTTLVAGTSYTFSYWMRTNDTTVGYDINVAAGLGQNENAMIYILSAVTGYQGPTWTKFSFELTPVTSGDYSFGIQVTADWSPNGINFDDFYLGLTPTCVEPTAVSVSNLTATSGSVSWTAPSSVVGNGYDYYLSTTNTAPLSTDTPTGSVAAGLTTVALTGLTPATTYYVWVRSVCSATDVSPWSTSASFTTECVSTSVPFSQNFESATVPAMPMCSATENAGLGNNWTTASVTSNGFSSKVLKYAYNGMNNANAWFYTQAIALVAGTSYDISYKYGNNSSTYVEKLKVAYSNTAAAASMTTVLADHPSITGSVATTNTVSFTPTVSGDYYFGFNAYSDADQYDLYVDDIMIDATLSNNSFDASGFAYYPNPVKNVLNLSYTKTISNVEVYNLIGQQVIVKSLDANQSQIDMSSLTQGTYLVKVTSDNQVKTIKVIKE